MVVTHGEWERIWFPSPFYKTRVMPCAAWMWVYDVSSFVHVKETAWGDLANMVLVLVAQTARRGGKYCR